MGRQDFRRTEEGCVERGEFSSDGGGSLREVSSGFVRRIPELMVAFIDSVDLLTTYRTKRTPITTTHFTPRNLCLVAGTYQEN
jgi:hypothetical protein